MHPSTYARNILSLCTLLCQVWLGTAYAQAAGTGFATLQLTDPIHQRSMSAAVFYPASQPNKSTLLGPYQINAEAGLTPEAGRHPLILISHGNAGSRWGHHDLAEFLAQNGFVVAALEHPGDNFKDQTGVGTDQVLLGRARQISALASSLLASPVWSPLIDSSKIGVAGFSAGGYTGLLLAGARPDFNLIKGYCQRHASDAVFCHHPIPILKDLRRWGATDDARFKAVFAMAPIGMVFDAAGLKNVNIPVFIYLAADDQVLLPAENALHLRPLLPRLAGFQQIDDADHYVFLAPCTPALRAEAPELCIDPKGLDRVQVHARINQDALAFFRQALNTPLKAPD